MMRENGLMRILAGAAIPALLMAALGACAPTGTVPALPRPADEQVPQQTRPAEEIPAAGQQKPYDLEEEMPVESGPARKVEEDIEPVRPDTFRVEEAERPAADAQYDLGYRIQVFASGSLDAAREMQKKVMAGTGLAAYIEFEEGLYKVRAGDFSTREEASAARTTLAQTYPDCWIVRTTVRTVR
ncbi:MAG: SPOR domain-containing protein [Candidatus Krumholzibacteria bacterium]|nr:SPOR domain-containing protein [Candidatus Krumholzibacteria bacterium]